MALSAPITPAEYLAAERKSDTKHELVNGVVYAMSGVSRRHWKVTSNLVIALGNRLRGSDCSTGASDLRVRIPNTESYLYPDVIVYCGEGQWMDGKFDTLENPLIVLEVLSPSTEDFDKGAKFEHYKLIESLQHYVVVDPDEVMVQLHTRLGDQWTTVILGDLEQTLNLAALELPIPLKEVYEGVPASSDPKFPRIHP